MISNVGRVKKETSPTTRSSNDITNDSGDQLDGLIVETAKKSGGGMKLSLDLSAASMKGGKKPKMAHPMSCPPMYLLKQRKKWPGTPMQTFRVTSLVTSLSTKTSIT